MSLGLGGDSWRPRTASSLSRFRSLGLVCASRRLAHVTADRLAVSPEPAHRDGGRPEHGRRRRGPEFVRTSRPSMPTHDARVVRLAVQAFACLMVDRSNATDRLPPPTPEEITMAVATVVHEDIVVRCDSSSSGEERAAGPSSSVRLTDGDVGYGPVRAANPAAARRGPAGPRPSAKRLPRWWRYTDILE